MRLQQRFSDIVRTYPFFFLRRKKNLKKKELQGGCPLDPRCTGETPQPHVEAVGRIQYRPHNADRSKRGLLNVLPRTILGFPLRGSQSRGRTARLAEQTHLAPNTETFSAVHNISVVWLSRLARSPGGLGGRSRIEFIVSPLPRRRHNESHFAAEPPERSFFFPLFLSPRKKKRLLAAAQS